jgi:alkanesulfonate monooxygenase SsuD/methylene tetrahydromethanopterin reductase-like flavin-dependent oxidoreductase (luciferase family)
MSVEYYQHKLDVLKRHCDKVGRDFGEIKRTILMPTMVTDDESAAAAFLANRRLGAGTLAGPKNYVIDCIGKFVEAGVDEIMFGGIPADDLEGYQRFDAEVLAAFD